MAFFSGIAAAIGTAFTAVSSFIGGLGVVGSLVLKTAVNLGIGYLAQRLAGNQDASGPNFSVSGKLQGGGDVPRTLALGLMSTAGSLVWHNTWGNAGDTPNAYFTQVVALSDMPVQGMNEMWVNGEKVSVEPFDDGLFGRPITEYRKNGVSHMWVKFYDGTQTEADQLCVQRVSGANGRLYEASRVGHGVAYAVVTSFVGNQSGLFSGWPTYKFVLTGMRLYDPTRDSTRGGAGAHRLGQPETWGGDGDHFPAVQALNLMMGLRYGIAWFYGLQGLTANRLPAAHWIVQIAKCRAAIAGPNGNEATYRAGGEVPVSAPLAETIEALLSTCQGRLSEIGGFYKIHLGAPDTPIFAFTDGEIISTEGQSFTPFFGLADTINGITATHPSPEEGWNVKSAPPLYDPTLEAQDGNRRLLADVPLDFVPYAGQVQRLMQSALREARRARRHTFVLPPEAWVVEPGDTVQWTSSRNGYVTKLFRVDGVVDRANLDVMVDITEIDPADYDWDQEADYRTPVDGPVGVLRPAPQVIVDWFASADAILDNEGRQRRPAIRLSWDGSQADIAAVLFEVRLAETQEIIYRGRTDNVEAGAILISQGLLPATLYEVHGRYQPRSDRETLWSGWLPVTTLDIRLGELDIYLPGMVEEIIDQVGEIAEFATEGAREALERVRALARDEENEAASAYLDRQVIRQETALQVGAARSFASETLLLAVGPNGVITSRLNELGAELDSGLSTVTNLVQTEVQRIDGELIATGEMLDQLSAEVAQVEATLTIRAQVVASPGGGITRYVVQAKAGSDPDFVSSSLFLEADSNGIGSAGFITDRFFIMNPSGTKNIPFVFESGVFRLGGGIRASWAQIDNVQVTSAQIQDAAITSTKRHGLIVE